VDADLAGTQLLEALAQLEGVADALTPDEALRAFDDATLQAFWREWGPLSKWAGALWRMLNSDMEPASRASDSDELGGSG
jgi:hypothetical protein